MLTQPLQVEDTGIGMSYDFQENHLFRPFQQENSLTPGTGLVCISLSQANRE